MTANEWMECCDSGEMLVALPTGTSGKLFRNYTLLLVYGIDANETADLLLRLRAGGLMVFVTPAGGRIRRKCLVGMGCSSRTRWLFGPVAGVA